jgi:REP element-mobilizing transposase RayT
MRLKRLKDIYKDSPVYFLTLDAHDRRRLFANSAVHEAFRSFCLKAIDYGIAVGRYVLMPDHIHLFAAFGPESIDVSRWIKSLKNIISKCLRVKGISAPHWQKGFFDRVLRTGESYNEKWEYVRQNPVRAGLAESPENWEFQGEIHPLDVED